MTIQPLKDSIHFENDGRLELFTVGVGSAFTKEKFQNNVLIIKGKDHVLIDCGTLCPLAFYHYNSSLSKVKNFLITHSHADHIGGLEEVALTNRYVLHTKPNMIITTEYKRILWNQSLRGGNSYSEYAKGDYLCFDDFFNQIKPKRVNLIDRPMWQTKIGSLDVKIFRTKHIPDNAGTWKHSFYSVGVLIDNRIFFTGDTRFDKDLIDSMCSAFPKIEVIFHDCQLYTGGVHAGYDELKTLPSDIKTKMILCHYGDNYNKFHPENEGFIGFAQQGVYYQF
jgi:ribonuclease BN (tRNA processing enzyme)